MNRNAFILLAVIATVALTIYFGARLSQRSGGGPPISVTAQAIQGKQAPDFELKTLDGRPVRLSSLRGKAVLVNFWATWCAPCKIEIPWMVDLYKQYKPQGFEIVGVAMDDTAIADIAQFVKEEKMDYTILQGTEAVGDTYGGVQFLPASFFIDRNGKIVKSVYGINGASEIEANIKLALGPGTSPQAAQAGEPTAVSTAAGKAK